MLHDNYFCSVESNKQQSKEIGSKTQAETPETKTSSMRVRIRLMYSAYGASRRLRQKDRNEEIKKSFHARRASIEVGAIDVTRRLVSTTKLHKFLDKRKGQVH